MNKTVNSMLKKELILRKSEIDQRVEELGREISNHYSGNDLVVVGVLKGAFVFLADLIRAIDLDIAVDFLQVASYGPGHVSAGAVKIGKDIDLDIAGKDVLIVEDILDTGHTLMKIKDFLTARQPRSIRSCVLIDKQERRQVDIRAEYVGFVIEKGFLIGCGLDYSERYRHYPDVYSLTGL